MVYSDSINQYPIGIISFFLIRQQNREALLIYNINKPDRDKLTLGKYLLGISENPFWFM